jgi:hypothetical protein
MQGFLGKVVVAAVGGIVAFYIIQQLEQNK